MKRTLFSITILGLVSAGLVMSGCETYPQAAGTGAMVGAGTGAVISHEKPLKGALIGGAVGAMAGLVAHDIVVQRSRDAEATAAAHQYKPDQGQILTLENESATPESVAPGHVIEGTVQYALLGAGPDGVTVTETRELLRNDEVVGESTNMVRRTDGTWISRQDFQLPPNAPPGEYKIVQRVETPRAKIAGTSDFHVGEPMAKLMPGENPYESEPRKPIYPPTYGPGPEGY